MTYFINGVEKIIYFINGLQPSIQWIVARYLESQPRRKLSYKKLLQFDRDEREAFRAQASVTRGMRPLKSARIGSTQGVNLPDYSGPDKIEALAVHKDETVPK